MNFNEYLIAKKIDGEAFKKAEPALFQTWNSEFDQMHVNSFTVQKLNAINPIRRKYQLKEMPPAINDVSTPQAAASSSPARVARPIIKPKK